MALDALLAGYWPTWSSRTLPTMSLLRATSPGMGRTQHREFLEASGEMSSGPVYRVSCPDFGGGWKGCRDGAIAYVCMDWRQLAKLSLRGKIVFSELKNICVWAEKTNGGMGTFYRSQHEMVLS